MYASNALVALSVAALMACAAVDTAEAGRPATMAVRTKRQLPPIEEGNQVIDDIFQIPIGTLNAVGSLIKSTRPLVRRTRQRIQQYYNGNGQPASQYQQQRPQYAYSSQNNRPYYNNRNRQQRDEPPAEGRRGGRRGNADDY